MGNGERKSDRKEMGENEWWIVQRVKKYIRRERKYKGRLKKEKYAIRC